MLNRQGKVYMLAASQASNARQRRRLVQLQQSRKRILVDMGGTDLVLCLCRMPW